MTIEEYPFEVFPQFSHATGELCQVLFRAADAEAGSRERMSEILTSCYGRPVERGTKRTWWGPTAAVELDTVRRSSHEKQLWLRWYPITRRRVSMPPTVSWRTSTTGRDGRGRVSRDPRSLPVSDE